MAKDSEPSSKTNYDLINREAKALRRIQQNNLYRDVEGNIPQNTHTCNHEYSPENLPSKITKVVTMFI